MKYFLILLLFLSTTTLFSEQLKIKSDSFHASEKKRVTVFKGKVQITKGADELNATVVSIYTDKKNHPVKYVAEGSVSFYIKTQNGAIYKGHSERAIVYPNQKEYQFFKNVHLEQINENKQINGEEVIVNTEAGTAQAKGDGKAPVIMTFEIEEKEEKK